MWSILPIGLKHPVCVPVLTVKAYGWNLAFSYVNGRIDLEILITKDVLELLSFVLLTKLRINELKREN